MIRNEYQGEFGEEINRGTHAGEVREMDLATLHRRVGEVTLLDVRDGVDYATSDSTIEGAARVSPDNLKWMDGFARGSEYVLFGGRPTDAGSYRVARAMAAKGFPKVSVLKGSLSDWKKAGFPVTGK